MNSFNYLLVASQPTNIGKVCPEIMEHELTRIFPCKIELFYYGTDTSFDFREKQNSKSQFMHLHLENSQTNYRCASR
jgi:hypothetical protein